MKFPILSAVSLATPALADQEKPNVLFLLADDWGWGDVGFLNTWGPNYKVADGINKPLTPRLDKLASEGTAFTHFHTVGAECSPSRASFMTGRSPSDDDVRIHLVVSDDVQKNKEKCDCNVAVPADVPTVTSVMKDAGYAIGHFGKWHIGAGPDAPHPEEYGIEESITYVSNALPDKSYPLQDEWFAANSTRWIVDDGINFMKAARSRNQPFYLNLWIHISHAPLRPSPEQLEKFPVSLCPGPNPGHQQNQCAMQVYRASQYEADHQIGRLLDWMDSEGVRDDTLFVFTTDNGPEDPHLDWVAVGDPGPFRGRKRSLYEGGVRVPFIASWPGKIPANVFSSADIMSADWLPTVAGITGTILPKATHDGLMGRDATALLLGQASRLPRKIPVMWDYRNDNTASGYCWHGAPRLAILDPEDNGLKLLTNVDGSRVELYNLTQNTFETNNLAQFPEMKSHVQRLSKTVIEWSKTLGPLKGHVATYKHMGCEGFVMPTTMPEVELFN